MAIDVALAGQSLLHRPLQADGKGLGDLIDGADVTLTGFEGSTDVPEAWTTKDKTVHAAPPGAMASLRRLGFNALALANNHAFDLGAKGLSTTLAEADVEGFLVAGTGNSLTDATGPAFGRLGRCRLALISCDLGPQPDIVRAKDPDRGRMSRPGINAVRIRREVAVPADDFERLAAIAAATGHAARIAKRIQVGYQPPLRDGTLDFFGLDVVRGSVPEERYGVDAADADRLHRAIDIGCRNADLVVVCTHSHLWAPEWSDTPEWIRGFARGLIDAGAHIVVGHGTPIPQGMEIHNGRPIFHGLGNLAFHTRRSERYRQAGIDVWRGIAARCRFDPEGRTERITVFAVDVSAPNAGLDSSAPAPCLLSGEEADRILRDFYARSQLTDVDADLSGSRLTLAFDVPGSMSC